MPAEADAIIQIEDTQLLDSYPDGREKEIKLLRAPERGEDIREPGSDIRFGETLFLHENPLSAAEIALAASCGQLMDDLPKVRVAVISTGDELVQPGASLLDGQVTTIYLGSNKIHAYSNGTCTDRFTTRIRLC